MTSEKYTIKIDGEEVTATKRALSQIAMCYYMAVEKCEIEECPYMAERLQETINNIEGIFNRKGFNM